jgi:hypothetical protein
MRVETMTYGSARDAQRRARKAVVRQFTLLESVVLDADGYADASLQLNCLANTCDPA